MQVLYLNKDFFQKLNEDEKWKSVLKLYGYDNADQFLNEVIIRLNSDYSEFLNIKKYDFLNKDEEKIYYTYNGYISNVSNYEVSVSFSDIATKQGNTIISQQVMPFINSKVKMDPTFLYNEKYKKIFILSSFISKKITSRNNNIINDNKTSSLQMLTKCLNNLSFEIINFFQIKNLSISSQYNNIEEFINNLHAITGRNTANNQNVKIDFTNNKVIGSCNKRMKGQDQKYFALRFYTALMLNNGYSYNLDNVTKYNNDSQILNLANYCKYINDSGLTVIDDYSIPSTNVYIVKDDPIEYNQNSIQQLKNISKEIKTIASKNGRKYVTQKKIKDYKIKQSGYICDCHDSKHYYFISNSTKKNYLEGHHIIPMNQQSIYEMKLVNLDVIQNISPLCPTCHRKIHNGTKEEKMDAISKIYNKNKKDLHEIDRKLSLEKLAEYYNIYN